MRRKATDTRLLHDSSEGVLRSPHPSQVKPGSASLRYVLVTPARNEVEFVGRTIESVLRQTNKPVRWVIVSDGSTDGTDELVQGYACTHPWIELRRRPNRPQRHFAGKVLAFNEGYAAVQELAFDVVGSLDADVTFDSDEYFAALMDQFDQNPKLGVAGTPFSEEGEHYNYNFTSIDHVSGACQMFRRACFDDIGGYIPIEGGGIDLVAVTTARMKGWQTRTFLDKVCTHHRSIGTASSGKLMAAFRTGKKDYAMGTHPIWQLARCCYQMSQKPLVVGGIGLLSGFVWSLATRAPRPVTPEFVVFRQNEQMDRLRKFLARLVSKARSSPETERG